jgi:hypothetical protein
MRKSYKVIERKGSRGQDVISCIFRLNRMLWRELHSLSYSVTSQVKLGLITRWRCVPSEILFHPHTATIVPTSFAPLPCSDEIPTSHHV